MPRGMHHTPTKSADLTWCGERIFKVTGGYDESHHRTKSWSVLKEQTVSIYDIPLLSCLFN